jgi:hypothetical protein
MNNQKILIYGFADGLWFETVGIPPKRGAIIGGVRVRTVVPYPDYVVVVLGRV